MPKEIKWLQIALVVLIASLFLAACGGDEPGPTGPVPTYAPPTVRPTDTVGPQTSQSSVFLTATPTIVPTATDTPQSGAATLTPTAPSNPVPTATFPPTVTFTPAIPADTTLKISTTSYTSLMQVYLTGKSEPFGKLSRQGDQISTWRFSILTDRALAGLFSALGTNVDLEYLEVKVDHDFRYYYKNMSFKGVSAEGPYLCLMIYQVDNKIVNGTEELQRTCTGAISTHSQWARIIGTTKPTVYLISPQP